MGKSFDELWIYITQSNLELFKEKLEESDININDTNRYGDTILHRYIFNVDKLDIDIQEGINLLIKAGVEVNISEKTGEKRTALHIAVLKSSFVLCKILLDNGAQIDAQDKNGNTPLWAATMNYRGREEMGRIIELLLEKGADPTIKNNFGNSPLDLADKLKGTDVAKYFEKYS